MPGFNQQGPINQGPMTGRGMGRCTNGPVATSPNFGGGQFRGQGAGFRRGRCQGIGRGQGYAQGPMETQAPGTMEDLKLRAQTLESELNAVKEALAKL